MTTLRDDEILLAFIEESREHLQDVEGDLLAIEEAGAAADEELVNKVFRAVHSVKGGASFLGLERVADLAHSMEGILNTVRNRELVLSPQSTTALLEAADVLAEMVADPAASSQRDTSASLTALAGILEGDPAAGGTSGGGATAELAPASEGADPSLSLFTNVGDALRDALEQTEFLFLCDLRHREDLEARGRTLEEVLAEMAQTGIVVASRTTADGERTLVLFATVMEEEIARDLVAVDAERIAAVDPATLGATGAARQQTAPEGPVAEEFSRGPDEPLPDRPEPDEPEPPEPTAASRTASRQATDELVLEDRGDGLEAWSPIWDGEHRRLGYVEISFSKGFLNGRIRGNAIRAWLVCLGAILLTVAAGLFVARRITRPLAHITRVAQKVATGDLGPHELTVTSSDEVGHLTGAFRSLSEYLETIAAAANRLSQGDLSVTIEPRSRADVLSQSFLHMAANLREMFTRITHHAGTLSVTSQSLSEVSEQVAGSVANVSASASTVASGAEEMSATMGDVSSMAKHSSENIDTVATSTEEMTATVAEIAQNAERGRQVASSAVQTVESASSRVDELGRAASEIGKVIEVIEEIAEQTKLLALNATIEAASAGEAGRGFSVVANEVKELAKQTDSATDEIRAKVESIQQSTDRTVAEMGQILSVITEVSDIVTSIASAVEEQAVTTRDIAQNIGQAAVGMQEMTANVGQAATASSRIAADIASITRASREVAEAVQQVNHQTLELSRMGAELREMVGQYRL